MSKSYKIAGQAASVTDTDIDLYEVPADTDFVSSTLCVVNRETAYVAPATFRIAIVPSGETLANEHYIEFDRFIVSRDSRRFTLGFSLAEGDKVVVRANTAKLSFSLFGVEITPNV